MLMLCFQLCGKGVHNVVGSVGPMNKTFWFCRTHSLAESVRNSLRSSPRGLEK